jgi:hypothetical protein
VARPLALWPQQVKFVNYFITGNKQGGALTRDTAVDLVLGGHAHLLIGLPENSWLEVKAQHYNLATTTGTVSIADAVSRFCNAEDGGVVIVGMDTSQRLGVELIRSVRPARTGSTRSRTASASTPCLPVPVTVWSSSQCRRNPKS